MKQLIPALMLAVALHSTNLHAGCGHLFKPHHVQQVVAVPVVQNLFYSVGDGLLLEAAVEKAFQRREALQQQQVAPATLSVFASKCARCHTGSESQGGDLTLTISDKAFRRGVAMLGEGANVPPEMKAVVAGLTADEKGELTSLMLRLPAKLEQPPPVPTPFDSPGVLR
jgi:hypothetical protein